MADQTQGYPQHFVRSPERFAVVGRERQNTALHITIMPPASLPPSSDTPTRQLLYNRTCAFTSEQVPVVSVETSIVAKNHD